MAIEWTPFSPSEGWSHFQRSEELNASLWRTFLADEWVYMNFTSTSSVWESRQDGSLVAVELDVERVAELAASGGLALQSLRKIAEKFGLICASHGDACDP